MNNYIIDPWKIIEEGFNPEINKISESLFSIGNGSMGQRGNFEESYSGDSLQGSYIGGVYYPDKTKVGWWKNGYPEYFAKILNSTNWIGLDIAIQDEVLDLSKWEVEKFRRELDMKNGVLSRSFIARSPKGRVVKVECSRFISMKRKDIGIMKYSITPISENMDITVSSYLDGNITNLDSNYNERFWTNKYSGIKDDYLIMDIETKKTHYNLYTLSNTIIDSEVEKLPPTVKEGWVSKNFTIVANAGYSYSFTKIASLFSSFNYPNTDLSELATKSLDNAISSGWDKLLKEQEETWDKIWGISDIEIEGEDYKAQQGIRYNIFQLNQTYTGEDSRLNIGPKGFTGEKYGGTTYWDTEAYCLPFYLGTKTSDISRNILKYRYNQLGKAIENANKLGIPGDAALFPMVTINGEECHNEWEITFEEIHRNGAIAYAIFNYINATKDDSYLLDGGLEVLVAISRYWIERVSYSTDKKKYVILGVTGPNEYENNVNNNWYTNTIAIWTLEYTYKLLIDISNSNKAFYDDFTNKLKLTGTEVEKFLDISSQIYLPETDTLFLQQDGFMDKEIIPVSDLPKEELPLNQNWSWDRILRSCFIKQADVLQGIFFFEDKYTIKQIKDNFDFYEPLTLHESSLSPCIHSIIASKLGYKDKAYELYLRTARLDLDNINNDTEDGCHITSMAGTWMSITYGFAGLRYNKGLITLSPSIPEKWKRIKFKLISNSNILDLEIFQDKINIKSNKECQIKIYNKIYNVDPKETTTVGL